MQNRVYTHQLLLPSLFLSHSHTPCILILIYRVWKLRMCKAHHSTMFSLTYSWCKRCSLFFLREMYKVREETWGKKKTIILSKLHVIDAQNKSKQILEYFAKAFWKFGTCMCIHILIPRNPLPEVRFPFIFDKFAILLCLRMEKCLASAWW